MYRIIMRRGFTLVEISIVLVILGLLIGGILVAQSMISAAVITNQVQQFQQFDIAVTNFQSQFKGLPADNGLIPIGLTPAYGDKDGLINCIVCDISHNKNEYCNFWPQLSQTNMLKDGHNYGMCDNPTPTTIPNSTMPASKLDKDKPVFVSGITANNKNYYTILNNANVTTNMIGGGSIIPSVLAALDAKLDDGKGTTGIIVARASVATIDSNAIMGAGPCLLASGNYNLSTTTVACIPRIEMLINQ